MSAENFSDDELFELWQMLLAIRSRAEARINDVSEGFDTAATPDARKRCWEEMTTLWSHYLVLSAWTDVIHAAWIFSTEGHDSMFLAEEGSPFRTG